VMPDRPGTRPPAARPTAGPPVQGRRTSAGHEYRASTSLVTRMPQPQATFSESVTVNVTPGGKWIHGAGQVAPTAPQADAGAFEDEARRCFNALERALNNAGAGLPDVVKITAYLTSLDDYGAFAAARGAAFGAAPPASTAVGVAALLQGARVEVDAVAFVPA